MKEERRPYDMVNHESLEEHAVDRIIEGMGSLKKHRRKIHHATNALRNALGA